MAPLNKMPRTFSSATTRRTSGFTLIELLTVIAIIGILAAILIPTVSSVRESARSARNASNLRQIATALLLLEHRDGAFPVSWDWGAQIGWAAQVAMLTTNSPASTAGTRPRDQRMIQDPLLISPLQHQGSVPDHSETITNYAVNFNVMPDSRADPGATASARKFAVRLERLEQASRIILVGDCLPRSDTAPAGYSMTINWFARDLSGRPESPVGWPADILKRSASTEGYPAFRNKGKAHFAFADGHVAALEPRQVLNGFFKFE
jgi:prepilin-type N-terminal cleavage/methylation domain-containing protein/prepilin-type processing-associated H-X9-DG protein